MCGRYVLFSAKNELETHFNAPFQASDDFYQPSWNIPPGTINPVVLLGKARVPGISPMKWGLVPSFATDENIGFKMINARGETVDEKPSFKKSFQRKRCLIPVNGFYEWKKLSGTDKKLPFFIRLMGVELFAFAGLFEFWKSGDGKELFSYTIITTSANALLEPIHERMPVILDPHQYDAWLNPLNQDLDSIKAMIRPYPMDRMRAFRVGDAVSKTANNSPELIEPQM